MATLTISDLMAMVLSLVSYIHGEHSHSIDDCFCDLETPVATNAVLSTVSLEYLDIAQQKKKPPTIYDNFRVSSRSSLHILDFPDEVTHYLLSLFSLSELCQLVVPVCKRWRDMVYDPIHWQQLAVGELSAEHFTDCIRRAPLLKKLDLGLRDELNANEAILFAWGCPQLSELNMAFCDSLDNCLLQIISDKCKHLRQINLDGCRFVDDESLKLLSRIPGLSRVNISHCSLVQTEGVDILAKNLSCITELDIDGIPDIEDSAIFTLVEHHAGHMERLSVDGVELTDAAAKAITKFSSLVELKVSFALLFTDVALAHLKNMRLQVLKVKKGCDLSQGSLVDFFTASSLSSLHSLDLTECVQLHDDGIFAMVKACGHNLRHLKLCWCWNITDFGLEAIVKGCPGVETLEFVGLKRIEGYSLAQIPECLPRLVLLDLQQSNNVIDELVVEVVRQLPQLIAYNYYGERFKSTTRVPVPDLFPDLSK